MTSRIIKAKLPCPLPGCGSSDAYHEYDDGHGFCFSCNRPHFPNKEQKEYEAFLDNTFTYEYLPWRGVTKKTFKHYNVKTKVDKDGKPVEIGFPYPDYGAYKVRSLSTKEFHTTPANALKDGLFGKEVFAAGSHKYVIVTEGELDALSAYQCCQVPAVSVRSSVHALRDCIHDRAYLNSFERIYLAFDADAPGGRAAEEVARLFDPAKVYVVKFTNRKDANEYLRHGDETALLNLWNNAKRYVPANVVSTLDEFEKILSAPVKKGVPYPFKQLTDMTLGIRTGETVLITAQEKVGKTELMHFIEHKLLKETDDAIAAFFLEEPRERHLQAIAGIELGDAVHLPNRRSTVPQIIAAQKAVIRTDHRLHLYSRYGGDDGEALLDLIRYLVVACGVRYVLFDHLSMAVTGAGGDENERKALDRLSTQLELMVKELDFALIIVAHVNDNGQIRGSRYPGKVFDIRIDASRDLLALDPVERSTIYLRVVLSRYPGITGPAGKFIFNRETYSFTEEPWDGVQRDTDSSKSKELAF